MYKLFMTREIPFPATEKIKKMFDVTIWPKYTPPSKEDIINNAKGVDALVTTLEDKITCEIIEKLSPNLKIIAQYAVGFDNVDLECATKHGVYVTNTPDVLTDATADVAWALILSVSRRIVESDKFVRSGKWYTLGSAWHPTLMLGYDVYGKTIGIVGGGRIGYAVAKRAKGFDMNILYSSRSRHKEMEELGAKYVDMNTLFKESDIVSLHVPLTKETANMVNENLLRLMKKTSILINTARGKVVDLDALYKALKEGWIAGAGLDVYPSEPLDPRHPITTLDNVVLLPHIGSATHETRAKMADLVYKNLEMFFNGEIPLTLVNKDVLNIRRPEKLI
ncbi:lactate dehydrogenase-like oxidoreductase [Caldisphaera lagunensis DSM 15908]|uniref:Lactate dehydrogenase-like oxidoreductase n=1 Tax=Caldisphaera lagunensis (strain DSM 15908 / JCM 11604 / ANMR 0165 / IC-154) TaxID=1056495 RepID=L0AA85_CALLD|nr:glyoxylate reductase [Caldisphaera lagunensis]AFZ70818.1 lactate dehydrogenase-like oxidoreductase [Caldisphaera lagunensis DSM 15908]